MRRTVVVAVSFALAFAGVALAVSYKTGTYKAGSSTADGIKLRVTKGSFSVSRMSFRETCSNAGDSFSDRFTFVSGSEAKLEGTISRKGRLKGRYEGPGGVVTVTGSIEGSGATVKGSESGTYTPPDSTGSYDCKGSKTFHAKRAR